MKNYLSHPSSFAFELPATQLKPLLATILTPELPGFTHNDAYRWYSPWKDHCRKVVQVNPLKGASYIFMWGLCFDFLPVFSGSGNYHYQRTDKSVGLHLFCWPPGYWFSTSGQSISCRFSRFGQTPEDVESRLLQAFHEAQGLFVPWFLNCCDLHSALTEAMRQRTDPASRHNWPSPDYVTAFLSAANGDAHTGTKVLDEFWIQNCSRFPLALHDKLKEKLLAFASQQGAVKKME